MGSVDIGILGVVGLSALLSLRRGFVRETLSLLTWVGAFWVAFSFFHRLAPLFAPALSQPSARLLAAFMLLFVVILLLGGLAGLLLGKLVDATGLAATDRLLGALFGAVRGTAIVTVLVLLAGLTPLPRDPWWRHSALIPQVLPLAFWVRGLLPPEVARHFRLEDGLRAKK